jgi:hypothetical protein
MNVRDLITLLQKIPDHSWPVVLYDNGKYIYLQSQPEIIHVRAATPDILDRVGDEDDRGFAVVALG